MKYIEIRCPYDRAHTIHNIEYESCGNIIGGIPEETKGEPIYHCFMCGFSKAKIDKSGMLIITKIDTKNKRINFIRKERIIKDE
jgi:hypothetical protein